MSSTHDLEVVAQKIGQAERILLSCHRGPDGDSVGSLIALATLLRNAGKKVVLYNPDLVPRYLKWLPLGKNFVQKLKKKARFDLCVVVDCGDEKLLGDTFPTEDVRGPMIALDHHGSGRPFGDFFVSDPSVAAIAVMVVKIADILGWPLEHDAALGVYVAIVADTGGFRYSNTNAEVLRLAARLVDECGVDPAKIGERMSKDASPGRYRLLSKLLANLDVCLDGKVAFMMVDANLLKECRATWEDTEGLINYARQLRGVSLGVLISPSKYGGVRVSMRARGEIDAGKICFEMGGGGHSGAAGCTLKGTLLEARKQVESVIGRAAIENQ